MEEQQVKLFLRTVSFFNHELHKFNLERCAAPLTTENSFPTNFSKSFEVGQIVEFECRAGKDLKK